MRHLYINHVNDPEKRRSSRRAGRIAALTAAGALAASLMLSPVRALAGPGGGTESPAQSPLSGPGGGAGSSSSSGSLPDGATAGYGVSAGAPGLGAYRPDPAAPGAIAKGIDVSYWNQNINWGQAASDNIQFAMLATRFRGEADPFFPVNADAASKAGLKLGAYIYSYATTPEMAEQEADFVINLIKDYPISFPVVFDAEDAETLGALSPAEVSQVINAFCRRVEAAGYHPMVYANEYWLNNKIDLSALHYDIWVARYADSFTYANPAMWQASNTGSLSGVNGNVDINYLYKDFTAVIPADSWKTINGQRYYYKSHVMQKNAWINDGQHFYYMDASGIPLTGWQEIGGSLYFLDAADGHMNTGWQQAGGSWYYLHPESGSVQTGWQAVDNAWYYLAADGRMQTGWIDLDGARYYLGSDGRMAAGWQTLDNARYYFGGDGRMATGWLEADGALYYLNPADGVLAVNTVLDKDGVLYQAGADGICAPIPVQTEENGGAESAEGQPDETGAPAGNTQGQPVEPAGPAG